MFRRVGWFKHCFTRCFMQKVILSTILAFLGFALLAAFLQFGSNTRYLEVSARTLRDWSAAKERPSVVQIDRVVTEAYRRILLYDDLINQDHLYEGMVVNRTKAGKMLDVCDSLLFSSLRFTALRKSGLHQRASIAWNSIEKSKDDEFWLRHPRCVKSTSRDMILGVMIALSQEPDRSDLHLRSLLNTIAKNNGYLSRGPLYVSYATPQISNGLRLLSGKMAINRSELPDHIRNGYSTGELSSQVLEKGFAAHLLALSIWLEIEVEHTQKKYPDPQSADKGSYLTTLSKNFSHVEFKKHRLQWQTHKLASLDPQNIFFRYLRLKSIDAMSPNLAYEMLDDLLSMPQFPLARLPTSCDRKADYLWQRKSEEYVTRNFNCNIEYNGIDFLWMASLLLNDLHQSNLSLAH